MMLQDPAPFLIIIDPQRLYADPASPWFIPDFPGLLPTLVRLAQHFAGRVLVTRFLVPESPEGAWREYYEQWSFARAPGAAQGLAVLPGFAGLPAVSATTFSKFAAIRPLSGNAPLLLCGVSTECCVLATALEAADAGVSVRIVADACASITPQAHQAALLVAETGFAPLIRIVSSESLESGCTPPIR